MKKTVLHGWHVENGANMALFGGYDMPLWYSSGVKAEHLAVIGAAGIFDTSHMAAVRMQGSGAREVLQHCFSKDLDLCLGRGTTPLVDGRCVYGVFLDPTGHVIDDAIVYQLQKQLFMVVVNAGMGGVISSWLLENSNDKQLVVKDLTDRVGKMDLQGPSSARVLGKIVKNPERLYDKLNYFSFKGGFESCTSALALELLDGTEILVSRTGYTGEFGFEIFLDIEKLETLWTMIIEVGQPWGVIPCGLASRDSLRAGALLPLSHQDIGDWPFLHNPWQFALPWDGKRKSFTKQFIGSDQLLETAWQKYTLPFCGFDPRKISAEPENFVTTTKGEPLGRILTCTTDMAIGRRDGEIVSIAAEAGLLPKGLSCGFVLLDKSLEPGELIVLTDGKRKRKIKVEIRADVRPLRTARKSIDTVLMAS